MKKTVLVSVMLLLLAAALWASPEKPAREINATDYGVRTDGTPCAEALQRAVSAAGDGGGVVYLPAGIIVLDKTVTLPANVQLVGEGASWENTTTTFHVKHTKGAAFVLNSFSGAKGIAVYYPDNLTPEKMAKPDRYDPCFEIVGCNVNLEYINIDGAYTGVSSRVPYGSNAGQCLFANINAFCHRRGFYMTGAMDVNRYENIHFFPSRIGHCQGPTFSSRNLIGFEFGRQDGATFNSCFIICGKGFFRQTREAHPGAKDAVISLGYAFTNCWAEDIDFGFDFGGVLGFTVLGCNVLVRRGGTGVIARPEAIGFNGVIKNTQIRGFGGSDNSFVGIDYDYSRQSWNSFYTNKLTVSDCVIQEAAPAVRMGKNAERIWVKDCLLSAIPGLPAIEIAEGACNYFVSDNLIQQSLSCSAIDDKSLKGMVSGNTIERL